MPAHVCDYAKFHAEDKSKTTRVCDHLDVFVAIWCILIKKQNKTKQNKTQKKKQELFGSDRPSPQDCRQLDGWHEGKYKQE